MSIARVVGAQPLRSETIDVNELLEALPRQLTHGQLARLLWMEDYWPVFVLTLGQFADVSEPLAEIFMGVRDRRRADVDRATVMRLVSSVVCPSCRAKSRSERCRSLWLLNPYRS